MHTVQHGSSATTSLYQIIVIGKKIDMALILPKQACPGTKLTALIARAAVRVVIEASRVTSVGAGNEGNSGSGSLFQYLQ